jgi:hypothetical protein
VNFSPPILAPDFAFNYQLDLPLKANFWPSQKKSAASKLGNLVWLWPLIFAASVVSRQLSIRFASKGVFLVFPEKIRRQ